MIGCGLRLPPPLHRLTPDDVYSGGKWGHGGHLYFGHWIISESADRRENWRHLSVRTGTSLYSVCVRVCFKDQDTLRQADRQAERDRQWGPEVKEKGNKLKRM